MSVAPPPVGSPGRSGPPAYDGAPGVPPGQGKRRRKRGGGTAHDGGRRRRPAHENALDTALRHRMIRLAVLPAALVAVAAAAVVAYVLRALGGVPAGTATGPDSATVWGVLGGALLLGCAVVVGAALFASSEARSTAERYSRLRHAAAHNQAELQTMLHRLEQGEWLRPPVHGPLPEPEDDSLGLVVHDVTQAQRAAELALVQAVALVRSNASGSEEKVEVFVNLARRLQSLVHREIELLDELENEVEDPDLLKGLFHVDHLATRIRRHAENLAVLGGAVSRRQWSRPVTMTEVLRSAIAEVEQYSRVKLVPPIEGTLRGHAVADVIHLLAELVENATVFSAPQTQVLLRAQRVTAGLAVEVEDRGLGMTAAEQHRMNGLLADPDGVDVAELLQDGRIGLFVVAALARRHGITVQLQTNIYGGTQAVLVVPDAVLGEEREESRQRQVPAAAEAGAGGHLPLPPEAVRHETPRQDAYHHEAVRPAPPAAPAMPHPARAQARTPQPTAPAPQSAYVPGAVPPAGTAGMPHAAALPHPGGFGEPEGAPTAGDRPQLPRRRRQEHLVPELRQSTRAPGASDGPEAEHNPGLMAAFRRGASLAEETDDNTPR
ncbi:sensor histidine kinase KdpD [Streptomyces sp. DH37]|uniref:sensor histidine kinase n=1 Tax=Streptomyces sp. DH37 TaxID=3040122 RepID=UPI0024436649|nr:ATP-binding protein [Streptomyces sp. DH37]MDG9701303.1 ATP-binding protein [Streptomyces sp. DH37]